MATLHDINHDSGGNPTDHWDAEDDVSGGISVGAAGALNSSSNGLIVDMTVNDTMRVDSVFTPPGSNELRILCYFDPNGNAQIGEFNIFHFGIEDEGNRVLVRVSIKNSELDAEIDYQIYYGDDASTNVFTNQTNISDAPHCVEIQVVRETTASSADGIVRYWFDGTFVEEDTAVENNSLFSTADAIYAEVDSNVAGGGVAAFYIDEILVTDDGDTTLGCGVSSTNTFRFLGFSTDDTNLYVTGLKDEDDLKLYDYDLSTLTENGTATFGGTVTSSDIDAQTRGIFPVAKPFADQVLYLYGRDGNNVQVQYNDLNGTLGWTDIGAGTATWGTDKMAAGLHPHPLAPNDVMVVFTDNDVYRTLLGTVSWAKMGDATGTVRTTARSPSKRAQLVAAGTAAGTIYHTQNIGVSFEDAGGTAMGTINAFEFNSGAVL